MDTIEKVILGRRGGSTSIKIIDLLLVTPCNINQISKIVNINYSTAYYHINLLMQNNILKKNSEGYGALYLPASKLKSNIDLYNNVKKELEKRNNIIKEAVKNE